MTTIQRITNDNGGIVPPWLQSNHVIVLPSVPGETVRLFANGDRVRHGNDEGTYIALVDSACALVRLDRAGILRVPMHELVTVD